MVTSRTKYWLRELKVQFQYAIEVKLLQLKTDYYNYKIYYVNHDNDKNILIKDTHKNIKASKDIT